VLSFNRPQVVPNLYELLNRKEHILKNVGNQSVISNFVQFWIPQC